MMQGVVTLIMLLWYLIGRTMTQGGLVIGRMEVREEMKTTAGKEVMTGKENETRTTGEGMCLQIFNTENEIVFA
jgi:hypothetical protein